MVGEQKNKEFLGLKQIPNPEPNFYFKSTSHVQVRRMEKSLNLAD